MFSCCRGKPHAAHTFDDARHEALHVLSWPVRPSSAVLSRWELKTQKSKLTPTSSLQAWRLATITRRALTRSTRTTQAPSPTQITEHHLQAVSCQSSSPLQCSSLDTQANECVDLSEFYLSRLILYDYGLSHVINCTYTLCYKYSEFCKIWLWKYSKKTYVHSFSFM